MFLHLEMFMLYQLHAMATFASGYIIRITRSNISFDCNLLGAKRTFYFLKSVKGDRPAIEGTLRSPSMWTDMEPPLHSCCHGGRNITVQVGHRCVTLNPINNHHIYFWGCYVLLLTLPYFQWKGTWSLSKASWEDQELHFLVDSLIAWII